ncbi:ABC transporter ATP-binding protein [Rhodoferax aquaticus]|uniref:ABC transporter ATP-binding protein n=1 Tax=Rhodoferax aquaticus TaxID=2527691 RepID=A0A515ER11_9BURK|nr:ABC transporter ATP-binding protein [Rhodoferax aquaticus]QDL55099.1 ABC transporter ATP-binding protein [Rhodoferax aquaticus]
MQALLDVNNLVTRFYSDGQTIHAVNGVSFTLNPGESMAIVGESGSGKSVSVMSVMRLIRFPPGRIEGGKALFEGQDLLALPEHEMRKIRGKRIAMIFQDPMTSLNPVLSVGVQMTEAIKLHLALGNKAARELAIEMLGLVGLPRPQERIDNFPHQFSGGQRQRIMIAMALACKPSLLIADEPTTALDVTIQAQIVDLIRTLQKQLGMAAIWISHNLALVAGVVDKVAVMYGGHIVEQAPVDALFEHPLHPYTRGLLNAIPKLSGQGQGRLQSIEGMPPDLRREPSSCPFAPRCAYAMEKCSNSLPLLSEIIPGRSVRCWRSDEFLTTPMPGVAT